MKDKKKTIYGREMQTRDSKSYSKKKTSVFFISNSNRESRQGITNISHTKFGLCDICVVANHDQSFKKALKKDGRFKDVNQFTLKRKIEGGDGSEININDKPSDFDETVVLEIKVSKTKKTKATHSMASTSENADVNPVDSVVSEPPRKKMKKSDRIELNEKLREKNALYVFSKSIKKLSKKEKISEMRECLEARALCTLVGPKHRGVKSLEKLTKVQYANHNVISRPVRFTKALCELYDSIGFLQCGTVFATCFLVSDDMIATNWHVVNDILKARRSSLPADHSTVSVHFDHENYKNIRVPLPNGHKVKNLSSKYNIICQPLDYALLYLEKRVERKTLGEFVQCKVPQQGIVCVVGHPGGKEKQDELCPILPLHLERSLELESRFDKGELHCKNNQSDCALSYAGQKCVHYHQSKLQKLCEEEKALTYDVGSFFHGASGSPVFDMMGNIVALHTGGFEVGKTSIVEFGVTFEAIIKDLKAKKGLPFVEKHFPNCK